MANSINTNVGALVALQNLNATNRDLNVTQNRVNTGMNVSSARDNGAIFAIATNQRAEIAGLNSVKQSLQRGQSLVDVALAAGETIVAALTEMKQLAVAMEGGAADEPSYDAYKADFDALQEEINDALAGAIFDGKNLFEEATGVDLIKNTSGGTFNIGFTGAVTVDAGSDIDSVNNAIEAFTANLATLGTQSKSVERQITFTSKMQDALEVGVGNLVDADLAKESARLTALQTKQQLGVQALSIANQSSSILLGLFR
ncbi:flagellin [Brevundimonas diminuta]|uniref:flagellin n=1 Tax=Brevundimonas diminuta TaxID=293 RepID=UPI002097414D|nr:flagellin [Brevundimonas diminuta]MCO8017280.1 flagellin [Brevundimonas diminuta]MCO8020800.1 flagellin [Brevundimonas diminuta]